MDKKLEQLISLRWEERNRALQKEFLRVRQEMNARGILNSSITIQNAHEVLVSEYKASRELISKTIIDFVKTGKKLANSADFEGFAQEQLTKRKNILERLLESEFSKVIGGLQNSPIIAPFRTLEKSEEYEASELTLELNEAIDTYNRSFGSNLTEQLRNQFLNRPILAVIVLSFAGVGFILGALKLLGVINFQ